MPRVHRATFGLETCMFSPHQMHAESALTLAASGAMAALAHNEMSLQSMIQKHGLGLVVLSADVEYDSRLTFFSAPSIVTDSQVTLRDDGKILVFRSRHSVSGDKGISIYVKVRPIKLSGGAALDAEPSVIDGELRARVAADELEADVPTRALQAQIDSWLQGAEKLGGGEHPLFIGRSDCELADQWRFVRLPTLVATAREQLAFSGARHLTVGMKSPLRSFRGEYFRPMFFGDRGRIDIQAFKKEERTFIIYRVLGALVPGAAEDSRPLCALAAEVF
ncbi:hypothetical protein [Hyalangium sp.]|uniref:hypothetical protein n=1 Tax=Hyalangium sp. TaxID=2028555 RepID=UPI002D508345|nr:hypothetical protein [Hyalangium sp.]HYH97664.1 hypothetical protein [Hyalangium sp.]